MGGSDAETVGGYTLIDRLGSGGMGKVYLARSASGRRVAVKLVHAQFAEDDEFRVRFRREIAAARRVSGAFTAPVVDADPEADRPWMATLYVPGPTLTQRVTEGGPLGEREVTQLALGLTEALRDIHRADVVHRDLKPANVLMAEDGPRVIDFGIAHAADGHTLTSTGQTFGTPPYMSPEQLTSPHRVGPASDIFSLAAVVTFAATGRGPFDAPNAHMTAYNVASAEPVLDGVPGPLRTILARCLDKDPDLRPGVDELMELFQASWPEDRDGDAAPPSARDALPTQEALPALDSLAAHDTVSVRDDRTKRMEAATAAPPLHPAVTGGGDRRRLRRRRVLVSVSCGVALALAGLGAAVMYGPGNKDGKTGSSAADSAVAADLPDGWKPWQTTLRGGDRMEESGESGSGCLVSGSQLYCGSEGVTAARLDAATGRTRWSFSADIESTVPLTVRNGVVVVNDRKGPAWSSDDRRWVTGLTAEDATVGWTHSIGTGAEPVGFGDWVVAPALDGRSLIAMNVDDGEEAWRFSVPAGETCAPWAGDGALFALCRAEGAGSEDGTLWRFDPSTGDAREVGPIPGQTQPVGVEGDELVLLEHPVDAEGEPDAYSAVLRVSTTTGATSRLELPREDRARGRDGVRLAAGTLYLVSPDGVVTAVSSRTAAQRWRRDTGIPGLSAPVLSEKYGALYFADRRGRLLALKETDGGELWRAPARKGTKPGTAPRVYLLDDAVVALAGGVVFSVGPLGPEATVGG